MKELIKTHLALLMLTPPLAMACGSAPDGESTSAMREAGAQDAVEPDENAPANENQSAESSSEEQSTETENTEDTSSAEDESAGDTSLTPKRELPEGISYSYDPTLDARPTSCADINLNAEEIYLDMFLILDRSGSMEAPEAANSGLGDCDLSAANSGTRWCNAIHAIHGFFASYDSLNTGLAYGDFAFSPCAGFDMSLEFALLKENDTNGHLAALEEALDSASPGSGTNTQGAINTLIEQTTAHTPLGKRKTVAVLVTDGVPYLRPEPVEAPWQNQACASTATTVSAHLSELNQQLVDHYQSNQVPTFIIGMDGVDAANLETLAQNAGSESHSEHCLGDASECTYYSVGDGDPTVFADALRDIRQSVVGCEYSLPSSEIGLSDLSSLIVNYSPQEGTAQRQLVAANSEACDDPGEYWVDQSSGADPIVKLCPSLCEARTASASINMSLSCLGQ
ncbi:MAG: VWA domain-containing protein [Polyangiaceae bacterium]|nr:VWA domain-containing protein [Polyangiaceae bacterium]